MRIRGLIFDQIGLASSARRLVGCGRLPPSLAVFSLGSCLGRYIIFSTSNSFFTWTGRRVAGAGCISSG